MKKVKGILSVLVIAAFLVAGVAPGVKTQAANYHVIKEPFTLQYFESTDSNNNVSVTPVPEENSKMNAVCPDCGKHTAKFYSYKFVCPTCNKSHTEYGKYMCMKCMKVGYLFMRCATEAVDAVSPVCKCQECGELLKGEKISQHNCPIKLKNIHFYDESYQVIKGIKKSLVPELSITPKNSTRKLVWSSSNPKIATVKNGVVTGKSKGRAYITVKDVLTGETAKCAVLIYQIVFK